MIVVLICSLSYFVRPQCTLELFVQVPELLTVGLQCREILDLPWEAHLLQIQNQQEGM